MPRRSFWHDLSVEDKAWLDNEIIIRGFQDYEELAGELIAKGIQTSKSAVARRGQEVQEWQEMIRFASDTGKILAGTTPDEADSRSAAVISMAQTGLFNAMLDMTKAKEKPPEEQMEIFSKSARSIADLTRASLAQKRHQADVEAKLNTAKQAAAKAAEQVAKQAGLTDDDWGAIRAQILGIRVQG